MMDVEHRLPSAYSAPENAEAAHGGRAGKYVDFLWCSDPLADAVMQDFAKMPEGEWRALLEIALAKGIESVPSAPDSLRALFQQLEYVPFWVDRERCNLGGATFLRCRLGFAVLAMLSLPLIYSWPAGNKALALSGQLMHRASQRLKDTTRYVFAVCQPDGLSRFSEGFAMTVRVRLIHAQVRRLLHESGQWRADAWGARINQCHMAGTNLMFSVGVLDGLSRLGYRFDQVEREALVHLWRYAGYLLGVDPELLIADEIEGNRLLDLMFAFEPVPDDDSRALVDALMQTSFEYLRGFKGGRCCSVNLCYGMSQTLIGDEHAAALGYPKTNWRWLVPAVRPATWMVETARIYSSRVQELATVAGPKAFFRVCAYSENGLDYSRQRKTHPAWQRLIKMDSPSRRRFVKAAAAYPLLTALAPLAMRIPTNSLPRVLLPPITFGAGQPPETSYAIVPPDKQFMASLPRLMELARLPGLGMGVIHGDQLMFRPYTGVANAKSKEPITENSLFPAASMGKQVFAYSVLRLVDEGRLDLDQPLKRYVSDDAPTGEWGEKITARHILSHSSGLPNWRDEANEPLVAAFEPGTKFRYSGEGFYYLQRCVEKITGVGCEAYMQERIFKPLGMNSSTYLWRADAGRHLVSGHRGDEPFDNRAFPEQLFHLIEKSGVPLAQWNHDRIVEEMGKVLSPPHKPVPNEISPNVAFSLLTTVADYSAFVTRITARRGDEFDLKPETYSAMMKPYSHVNSALSWGLGWGIEKESGPRYLWQWGDNGGWKNIVIVHPESHSALVVFTNGSNGMRVVERIAKAATGRDHALFLWV